MRGGTVPHSHTLPLCVVRASACRILLGMVKMGTAVLGKHRVHLRECLHLGPAHGTTAVFVMLTPACDFRRVWAPPVRLHY